MLEALHGGTETYTYVPNSGPGTPYLRAGDLDLGYFGEVSTPDLFSESALSAAVGLTRGVPLEENIVWLKFIYQGRILFVAKRPIRHSVSWKDLYQAGIVYGTGDMGAAPYPEHSPVFQIRTVKKDQWALKVQLLTGSAAALGTAGGEWNDLIYKVSAADPSGDPWETNSNAELLVGQTSSPGSMTLVRDRDTNAYARGYTGITDIRSRGLEDYSSYHGWRPVLELLVGQQPLYPLHGLETRTSGDNLMSITSVTYSDVGIRGIVDVWYDGDEHLAPSPLGHDLYNLNPVARFAYDGLAYDGYVGGSVVTEATSVAVSSLSYDCNPLLAPATITSLIEETI